MRTLLLLCFAPGCVFITDAEYADRLDKAEGDGGDGPVVTDDTAPPDTDDCEEADKLTFYADVDGDGLGDLTNPVRDCTQPDRTVTNSADCDDSDPAVGAPTAYYLDADGDGFGDPATEGADCAPPAGSVSNADDCDDAAAAINPAAVETCDTPGDDNCDGVVDGDDVEGCLPWYEDADGDGFGVGDPLCRCAAPAGYEAPIDGDCDDTVDAVHPGAGEVCNDGVDNDCDGGSNTCALSGAYDLPTSDVVLRGEANLDWAGWAAASVGDLSGDGAPDFGLAAHKSNTGATDAGLVYLVTRADTGTVDLAASARVGLYGDVNNSQLGYAIAGDADLTGDGLADLLLGAPTRGSGSNRPGAIWVVPGPLAGAAAFSVASVGDVWTGTTSGDLAGCAVATLGDIDGDGQADLAAGAYKSGNAGVAYLLYGPVTSGGALASADLLINGATAADRLGYALADGGDLDGDGVHELLVSADRDDQNGTDAGTVYAVYAPGAGVLSVADIPDRWVGSDTLASAGFALAGGGDLNGDGYDDALIGAPGEASEAGAAYVVYGPIAGSAVLSSAPTRIAGLLASDRVGRSLSIAGDVNRDGALDLLLGAQGDGETMTGGAALFYGPVSGALSLADADVTFTGGVAGDAAGYAVAGADLNLDGATDLLLTAPRADGQATDAGVAYVMRGGGL